MAENETPKTPRSGRQTHDRRVGMVIKSREGVWHANQDVVVVVAAVVAAAVVVVVVVMGVDFAAGGRSDVMMMRWFIHSTLELSLWLFPYIYIYYS